MTEDETGFEEYSKLAWQYAMRYLQMGWSIIPMRFSDKRPAIEWEEYQRRQPTEEEVTEWFETGVPDGNGGRTKAFGLAVVTGALSGVIVVDCDNQDALTYAVNEANLFSMLGVKTTRGQHMYFRHPKDGVDVRNKVGGVGRDWPNQNGLDLRGDGGYVVAPPSLKFNANGEFTHQYAWNCPLEELEMFVDTIPVWPGVRLKQTNQVVLGDDWSFANLNLSAINPYGQNVWDQLGEQVKRTGHKLRDGDGRNTWMVKYLGECVSSGMDEEAARIAAKQLQLEHFEQPLPDSEVETVLRSVITSDRRNHPEKYAAQEKYESKTETRQEIAKTLRLITPANLAELKKLAAGRKFLIDPFIPPAAIVQVVGFNGHFKTLWLLNLMWAASRGLGFGSGTVDAPVRSLYLDFESGINTLMQRIEDCTDLHGELSDKMMLWAASASGEDMSLTTVEGMAAFQQLVNEVRPQVIILDTVRQAWPGLEENSPHAWVKVNALAMACRNAGSTFIMVHHRNKPSKDGHGREAGSTAQLKDLDVQIFVTKVVEDLDQAKREACIPDSTTKVTDYQGVTRTAWSYLRLMTAKDHRLLMVFELSFGKVRQSTENHVTTYVGMAQSTQTGKWMVVHTSTPMQQAIKLASIGKSLDEIVAYTQVSVPTVKRWLKLGA